MLRKLRASLLAAAAVAAAWLLPLGVAAEPYLAVESGLKCVNCHVNPTGGGKRNVFGTLYARNQIAARAVTLDASRAPWTGAVNRWLGLGGDYRGGFESVEIPGRQERTDTRTRRATLYAHLQAVPNLLSFYLDERIAPGASEEREAYLLLTPKQGKYTVKAGQLFLPFGLRIEDDNAFVRQASGRNFLTPEDGLELGLELPKWSAQVAVADGAASGADDQLSLSAAYVRPRWRAGASLGSADDVLGDRTMAALFAGTKTGPIAWLAEIDFIADESPQGDRDFYATLLEGNWRFRKGHNLKLGYEYLEPNRDRGEDQQERYSLVWEYSPLQFVQARAGVRRYNGIPNLPASNRDEAFVELHAYF